MKIRSVFYFLILIPVLLNGQSIVADRTVVDDYDIIPQQYIDSVKKMWVTLPGESHSLGYRKGLQFLEILDTRFQASIKESGTPEGFTDSNLRFSRATWGDVTISSGWMYNYGEEDWYTSELAVERTKAGLLNANSNGFTLDATGFGWCWDMSWINSPGGTIDPIYNVRWGGSSNGGLDGNQRWGLDSGDSILTGNRVNMDTYINATEEYISYCELNNFRTKVFFTTGPVDENAFNIGESGYQRYLKTNYIREYMNSRGVGFLFDYSDILSWNDAGEKHTIKWTDYGGVEQEFEFIHPDNMIDLNGSYIEDGDHIGQIGTIRLAKAMWWMLARMAGWNGLPEGSDNEAPSAPGNLAAKVVNDSIVLLSWSSSTDNIDVFNYSILRDGTEIGLSIDTTYIDNTLDGSITYNYSISAFDEAGNESPSSASISVNTFDTLGLAQLRCDFLPGFNWFSFNIVSQDSSVDFLLSNIRNHGDYVKTQIQSTTYYEGFGWFGTLNQMDPKDLFMLKVAEACTVGFLGNPIDVSTTPINVYSGWNWIGYLPQHSIPISEAFDSFSFTEMDYIKDQTTTATYYNSSGWFGSLKELIPGHGYMLKLASSGSLRYSEGSGKKSLRNKSASMLKGSTEAQFSPYYYEFNASLSASMASNNLLNMSVDDMLYAFAGDQCCGVQQAMYFVPENSFIFPLMIYSNEVDGELITFKYYHAATDILYTCEESLKFQSDTVIADAIEPMMLHLTSTSNNLQQFKKENSLSVFPSPFNRELNISFFIEEQTHVELGISDITGRVVNIIKTGVYTTGNYSSSWDSSSSLPGIYIVKLSTNNGVIINRVVKHFHR